MAEAYTITREVIIPEERRLYLKIDLPADFPIGEAEVTLVFKRAKKVNNKSV